MGGELLHFDKAGQHGLAAVVLALEHQLVDEALAASAVMHREIFEFFEPLQMLFSCVSPHAVNARTSLRLKRKSGRSIFFRSHAWLTISSINNSKPPRLRRKFVERTA